jgi:hypothetical protein
MPFVAIGSLAHARVVTNLPKRVMTNQLGCCTSAALILAQPFALVRVAHSHEAPTPNTCERLLEPSAVPAYSCHATHAYPASTTRQSQAAAAAA